MLGITDKVLQAGLGLALIAVLALAGAAAVLWVQRDSARAEAKDLEAQWKLCRARTAEFEAAYHTLAATIREQNASILAAKEAAEREAAAARERSRAAERKARAAYAAAESLRGLRAPAGEDACTWARERVDEELKAERGK